MVQERADARDAFVAAVRVFLAEVARPHGERGGRLARVREPAGAQKVQEGIVTGCEPVADLGLERLELRVHAVAAEAPAQVDDVGRVGRRETRIEHDHLRHGATLTRVVLRSGGEWS